MTDPIRASVDCPCRYVEGPRLCWTENMPPSESCRYDHCIAETPFGRFLITWKSWKEYNGLTVDETPWGDWCCAFDSIDEAKSACQQEFDQRLARCARAATATEMEGPAVPEGSVSNHPSNKELDALERKCWKLDSVIEYESGAGFSEIYPKEETFDHRAYARAVLTRWGHQPAPVAKGEVEELLRELHDAAFDLDGSDPVKAMITRAADLLERLASPDCLVLKPSPELIEAFKDALPGRIEPLPDDAQVIEPATHTILVPVPTPVPVAERLPEPEDCDPDGYCWWFTETYPRFCPGSTHWLPAHAIPLPQSGEGEA